MIAEKSGKLSVGRTATAQCISTWWLHWHLSLTQPPQSFKLGEHHAERSSSPLDIRCLPMLQSLLAQRARIPAPGLGRGMEHTLDPTALLHLCPGPSANHSVGQTRRRPPPIPPEPPLARPSATDGRVLRARVVESRFEDAQDADVCDRNAQVVVLPPRPHDQ